jgi:hypothetical protein
MHGQVSTTPIIIMRRQIEEVEEASSGSAHAHTRRRRTAAVSTCWAVLPGDFQLAGWSPDFNNNDNDTRTVTIHTACPYDQFNCTRKYA